MSDLPAIPSSTTCPSCGFENTPNSLYCQDCGARLVSPPSSVAKQASSAPVAGTATTSKSKPRILSVRRRENPLHGIFGATVRVLILAAVVAVVILVLREPAGLPPQEAPLPADVIGNIRTGIQRNAQMAKPINVPWSGQGLNAFLAGVLASTQPDLFAELAPAANNGFTLFVRHKIGSVSFYTTSTFQFVSRANGLGLVRTAATIGRLPVPKPAMFIMTWADDGVVKALGPDLDIVRNAARIQTDPQQARVDFGVPTW